MGTIKKITAVKRRALCPKCFSVILWDNSTFEHYNSEEDSYYIICPAELNGSNCNLEIPINRINPEDYLDNDIIFEPVEGGEVISLDSEDINFNYIDSNLDATNIRDAIVELEHDINDAKVYNNELSELTSTTIKDAINELASNIKTVDEKQIQALSISYNNIGSNLTSTNTQNVITEINEKIDQINIENNNVNILLSEVKNTNNGTIFIFSGLDSLIGILNNTITRTSSLANYNIALDITHPTFVNRYMCLATYTSTSGSNETLHIYINNTETITVTLSTITWKTADSRTISISINAINSDGSYTYTVS